MKIKTRAFSGLVIIVALLMLFSQVAGAQGYPGPGDGYPATEQTATVRPTGTTAAVMPITPAQPEEITAPPTTLPDTGGDSPLTGMTFAEALLFATTTAGAAAVLGIAYSFIVQIFPQFTKLLTWQKIGALVGLSLGIPVGAALLRGALGYTEITAAGMGDAAWAGVVAFGLSQVTHNLRKALTSDNTEEMLARLIIDTATELQDYDRAKVWELLEQIKGRQEDGLGAVISEILRTILTYVDTLELRRTA